MYRVELGDELQCPHCRQWHPVVRPYNEGTTYTLAMLMWVCRGETYYAGQVAGWTRFPRGD